MTAFPTIGSCHTLNDIDASVVNEQDKTELLESIEIKRESQPRNEGAVIGFDVNKNSDVALAFSDKHVEVYNESGKFLYGFSMSLYGSYQIMYDQKDDSLMVMLVRSDYIVKIDENVSCKGVEKFSFTNEMDKLYRELDARTKISRNGNTYEILGKGLLTPRSIVCVTNSAQKKIEIYNNVQSILISRILGIIILLIFISICLGGVIREFKKSMQEKGAQ